MRRSSPLHPSLYSRPSYAVALALAFAASTSSLAGPQRGVMEDNATVNAEAFIIADAHPYRHCHSLPRRTYCHKQERLPQNWPPHSDTPPPGEAQRGSPCERGGRDCKPKVQNKQG